ncbi:MAG: hypothetical protein V3S98_00210, partial [Dehalococcoidia bacterium]
AQAVAEHGVHMLIETPLGLTRSMMQSIADTARKTGVAVEVGENMWRRPTERLNQQAVAAGLIGKVLRVSSYYESAGQNSCYHTMSLLRRYAGADVTEVRAFSQAYALDPDVTRSPDGPAYGSDPLSSETWTQAVLSFENGVTGTCTYVDSWIAPLRRGHPRFMSIEGTEGFIVTGDGDLNMLRRVERGVPTTYHKQIEMASPSSASADDGKIPLRYYYETDPIVAYENPYLDRVLTDSGSTGSPSDGFARAHELASIYHAVVDGSAPAYDIDSAFRDQELSIAITESAARGEALRTDQLPPETAWERGAHETFKELWGADVLAAPGLLLKAMGR